MKVRVGLIGVLLVVLALLVAPVMAQDATPEATPVIFPDGPTVVDDTVTLPAWSIMNFSLFFVAASVVLMLVDRWTRSRDLKTVLEHTSKEHKDAMEAAYQVVPPTWQRIVDRIVDVGENMATQSLALFKFLREVTDGKPNTGPGEVLSE
jgi:hypothetical protein